MGPGERASKHHTNNRKEERESSTPPRLTAVNRHTLSLRRRH